LKQDIAGLANLPGYDDWKASAGVKDRLSAFSSKLDADVTYIGFSTLAERTYQLVTPAASASSTTTGTTTPASTIQYDKNSSFQNAPLLLLHVRLCNLQDWGALHVSFGAGVTIPASGSGTTSGTGSQPTYLGGLSVPIRDKLYFTAGRIFGRTNTLANGYLIGSSLPSGVTTVPLETKFSAGFGVAVTFKLK
jgi:hypothetical protein